MKVHQIYNKTLLTEKAKALFAAERAIKRLDGWFLTAEKRAEKEALYEGINKSLAAAHLLCDCVGALPLLLDENSVFAGSQRDSFAMSYALINPSFEVKNFSGYCDPTAVYGDIEPNEEFTPQRIERLRAKVKQSPFVKALSDTYQNASVDTGEVVYFVEQVTGHTVADFSDALKYGVDKLIKELNYKAQAETDEEKRDLFKAMALSLESVKILAARYKQLAQSQLVSADGTRRAQLELMIAALDKVPSQPADTLYEAMQCYLLLWQVMCLEQSPNPFAFSVGNVDRIFEEYYCRDGSPRELATGLFEHFLVYFNVGSRSWAISQNLLLSGRDLDGRDLTNGFTYAVLDAYYEMNLPQPILSVKLHKNTPDALKESLGRFFFMPGCLTPSLFNDDAVFEVLRAGGVDDADLPAYAVAGCQEPLIAGKDNGNTTNSWLNLPKILELTLNDGCSLITGKKLTQSPALSSLEKLTRIRELFYKNLDSCLERMTTAANSASRAISLLPVPFLSVFIGGRDYAYDMRDPARQGTRYNGSGCLVHGLSVLADSFTAIDCLLKDSPERADELIAALRCNFDGYGDLREYLKACPKYGNNAATPDREAAEIASLVSDKVNRCRNYLGNPFRADFSSPTTHLLYGYWVGATPDGRSAREMLGYGVDPLYGESTGGMGMRILSQRKLDYLKFRGGFASHLGIDPKYFKAATLEGKGMEFFKRVIAPLFFGEGINPFYLYVNVTTADILRKLLKEPAKYAPGGVYIMRIHGTFVNFLDLSPEIQDDIIKRLDEAGTSL